MKFLPVNRPSLENKMAEKNGTYQMMMLNLKSLKVIPILIQANNVADILIQKNQDLRWRDVHSVNDNSNLIKGVASTWQTGVNLTYGINKLFNFFVLIIVSWTRINVDLLIKISFVYLRKDLSPNLNFWIWKIKKKIKALYKFFAIFVQNFFWLFFKNL